ncbi:MAG TPA: GFA family protein [Caulobacteraceae bacterium]|nr:GFA family protein [Caulobacteraceae bacterium]
MLQGSCHCGAVTWRFDRVPEDATACNCTVCRRYGVLWAYDFEDEAIHVAGPTTAYVRGEAIGFHFCPSCGCVGYWRGLSPREDGRRRIAVNLRLAEDPEAVADIPMRRFDGLETFEDLTPDGRCVRDYWF